MAIVERWIGMIEFVLVATYLYIYDSHFMMFGVWSLKYVVFLSTKTCLILSGITSI
jgi:hypothetical protein